MAQQLRRLLASSKHVADSALWLAGTGDALRAEALDKLARARGARQAEIVKNVEENASVLWARFTGTSIPGARPKVLNPEEVERRIGEITQQASTSIKQVSFVSYPGECQFASNFGENICMKGCGCLNVFRTFLKNDVLHTVI